MRFWLGLLACGTALAAPQYLVPSNLQIRGSSIDVSFYGAPAVADWDGDGRKDLLVGEFTGGYVRFYPNAGIDAAPVFDTFVYLNAGGIRISLPYGVCQGAAPQVTDWNADGRLDLVTGDREGYVTVFLRNTSGVLVTGYRLRRAGGETLDVGTNSMPFVTDWNRDGRKDLLIGNENGEVRVYLNEGTDAAPVFQNHTLVMVGANPLSLLRVSPCFADLTRDGRRDLVCGGIGGMVFLYANRGTDASPAFATVETLRTLAGTLVIPRPDTLGGSRLALPDWNDDGVIDILISGSDGLVDYYEGLCRDVAVGTLLTPVGILDSGTTMMPDCSLHNCGNQSVTSYTVRLKIGATYNQTLTVSNHAAHTTRYVTFPLWTGTLRGSHVVTCTTAYPDDMIPANNRRLDSIRVDVHDAGTVAIVSPSGTVPNGGSVTPRARVRNHGTGREPVTVVFTINSQAFYSATADLPNGLPPGVDTILSFPNWSGTIGVWQARCSTGQARDVRRGNDTLSLVFAVSNPPSVWTAMTSLPSGASGRPVKDGGALACLYEADSARVFALKGNKTDELYEYRIAGNTWLTRTPIPLVGRSGRSKGVKKGASLVASGGSIYAAKGNSTLEYWRFDPAAGTWTQVADLPPGAKTIKEGSGAVPVVLNGTPCVYFLKGSGTYEFYRLNPTANAWTLMAGAPAGSSGKPFKNGSCLAHDGDDRIYALKGSYNELFAYSIAGNTWTQLNALPFIGSFGRKKKVKDGAGIAFHDGVLYALKGGNTQEYWRFEPDSNRWAQVADIPIGSGKRVKGGGALVAAGNALYALKGNNTLEFFRYGPPGADEPLPGPVLPACCLLPAVYCHANSPALEAPTILGPNPARVNYTLPARSDIRLVLVDAAGRRVRTIAAGPHGAGTHTLSITRGALARGVYFLKLEMRGTSVTRRVVIE